MQTPEQRSRGPDSVGMGRALGLCLKMLTGDPNSSQQEVLDQMAPRGISCSGV